MPNRLVLPPTVAACLRLYHLPARRTGAAAGATPSSSTVPPACPRDGRPAAHRPRAQQLSSPTPHSTLRGRLRFWVAAVREDVHVAVSVSDEGPGMAPERLPNLFRRHANDGEAASEDHGLGLAIL